MLTYCRCQRDDGQPRPEQHQPGQTPERGQTGLPGGGTQPLHLALAQDRQQRRADHPLLRRGRVAGGPDRAVL